MRLRETGSIHIEAPRERVFEILARHMAFEPGLRSVPAERLDASAAGDRVSTFILRDAGQGTQVIHARTAPVPLLRAAPRAELREAVEAELFRVQRLVEASETP